MVLDHVSESMILQIQGFIWASDVSEVEAKVKVPKTWKDHLKQELSKKWPRLFRNLKVETREIVTKTVTRYAFPSLDLEAAGHEIQFAHMNRAGRGFDAYALEGLPEPYYVRDRMMRVKDDI